MRFIRANTIFLIVNFRVSSQDSDEEMSSAKLSSSASAVVEGFSVTTMEKARRAKQNLENYYSSLSTQQVRFIISYWVSYLERICLG